MQERPIGFLDSGVGGLTVIKAAVKLLPYENMVFIGDQAHLPYGNKTAAQIIKYVRAAVNFLQTKEVKAIVFACNTATAYALPVLQAEVDLPLLGVVESGARAALAQTQNQKIAVLATQATVQADIYSKLLHQLNPTVAVHSWAMPDFVPIVENNQAQTPQTQNLVDRCLAPVRAWDMDTIILGCTHYPILAPAIQASVGPQVHLVDAGAATAVTLKHFLNQQQLAIKQPQQPKYEFYTTGDPQAFDQVAQQWLPELMLPAQAVNLDEGAI